MPLLDLTHCSRTDFHRDFESITYQYMIATVCLLIPRRVSRLFCALLTANRCSFVTGIPNNMVTLRTTGRKKLRMHNSLVSLAEYGSFGVEFLTLTDRTGNASYAASAEAIYRCVYSSSSPRSHLHFGSVLLSAHPFELCLDRLPGFCQNHSCKGRCECHVVQCL